MRVLLITQYFHPENFKSNDIAFELKKRGYEVDALVGIPNYPEGKIYPGYGILKKRCETINGVNVYRTFQIPRGKSAIRLFVNYFSYAISATIDILFFYAFRKYDAVIVHEVSPIFQAIPAVVYKKLKKKPLYLWVLDIWPDALRSSGGINSKTIINFVDVIVKWVYDNSYKILLSSRRFEDMILEKGDYKNKMEYFPNWSDDQTIVDDSIQIPELPDGFLIMITGNLGKVQDLESVGECMKILHNYKELKWIFVGDGSHKEWLDRFIVENGLSDVAFTLGRFSGTAMPKFYQKANALLVTLKGDYPQTRKVVPARLQSYMSAGRPVLAMMGEGGADIIRESNCGYAVDAGDYTALADVILSKVLKNQDEFEKMGLNGRIYYEREFTKGKCMEHLCEIINRK
ncbi:MAG: glycosyltransferase family 4 protein [Bacteroidaceae bacterium]|nr:glycosyltransferase family 4 protein [Bacteroidaceae bacterium]